MSFRLASDVGWFLLSRALQNAFCRISCDVFRHLLALDLNFHVHRKTGQIMRILDRGTSSIQVRYSSEVLCTAKESIWQVNRLKGTAVLAVKL